MKDTLFESILAEASNDDRERAANRLFASTDQAEDIVARKASFEFRGQSYGIAARYTVTGLTATIIPLNDYFLYENGVRDYRFTTPSEAIDYILQKSRVYMPDVEKINTLEEVDKFEVITGEIVNLMKNVINSCELAKNFKFDKAFGDRAKAFNDLA